MAADITVRFYPLLRRKAGAEEFACHADTVRQALSRVHHEFGDDFMQSVRRCQVFVNGDNVIHLRGHNTRLKPGDTIHIFPPAAGG